MTKRMVGGLLILAAVSYLVDTILRITVPDVAADASTFIMVPEFIGEIALALWLVVRAGRMRFPDNADA
jgi:hypothetical protein